MADTETQVQGSTAQGPPSPLKGEGEEGDKELDNVAEEEAEEGDVQPAEEPQQRDKSRDNVAEELLISITMRGPVGEGGRYAFAFIGVRTHDTDPIFESILNPTMKGVLESVEPLLEVARIRWATSPKYPAYQRPAPPPRPVQPRAAARPVPAPRPKGTPKGQTGMFGAPQAQ